MSLLELIAYLTCTTNDNVFFREHARNLALENESLHSQVMQTEQDTIDVVGFLKAENEEKEKQVFKNYALKFFQIVIIYYLLLHHINQFACLLTFVREIAANFVNVTVVNLSP